VGLAVGVPGSKFHVGVGVGVNVEPGTWNVPVAAGVAVWQAVRAKMSSRLSKGQRSFIGYLLRKE
jgi:hypothetical protein